ncbi:MAG: dihydroorotate dehydrogenase (quinone) [Candidatus Caldarchaeum sp.]
MFLGLVYSFLARLPPETAHEIGLRLLKHLPIQLKDSDECFTVVTRFGRLRNPIGLAAGFDKDGTYLKSFEKLGFGYLVAGTVTRNFRKGFDKPRLVRRRKDHALVNAMGFPNPGLERFLENVAANLPESVPVVVSVADEKFEQFVECYKQVQNLAAAVEINISSPNTPQLRHYFQPAVFENLTSWLKQFKTKPSYLKTPPTTSQTEKETILKIVKIWHEYGFDGVTAVNTLLVHEPRVSVKRGGLSGKPLFPYMLKSVQEMRSMFGDDFEIHAVGGIWNGGDVFTALKNGATTVQIYTALVYRGLEVVAKILHELKEHMKKHGVESLEQIRTRR